MRKGVATRPWHLLPRRCYELDVIDTALDRNIVACVPNKKMAKSLSLVMIKHLCQAMEPSLKDEGNGLGDKRPCVVVVSTENAAKDFVAEMSAVSTCSHHHVTWMPDSATLLPSVQVLVMAVDTYWKCLKHQVLSPGNIKFCIIPECENLLYSAWTDVMLVYRSHQQTGSLIPKVFCTTSLLGSWPVWTPTEEIRPIMQQLKTTFLGEVILWQERFELEVRPKEIVCLYEDGAVSSDPVKCRSSIRSCPSASNPHACLPSLHTDTMLILKSVIGFLHCAKVPNKEENSFTQSLRQAVEACINACDVYGWIGCVALVRSVVTTLQQLNVGEEVSDDSSLVLSESCGSLAEMVLSRLTLIIEGSTRLPLGKLHPKVTVAIELLMKYNFKQPSPLSMGKRLCPDPENFIEFYTEGSKRRCLVVLPPGSHTELIALAAVLNTALCTASRAQKHIRVGGYLQQHSSVLDTLGSIYKTNDNPRNGDDKFNLSDSTGGFQSSNKALERNSIVQLWGRNYMEWFDCSSCDATLDKFNNSDNYLDVLVTTHDQVKSCISECSLVIGLDLDQIYVKPAFDNGYMSDGRYNPLCSNTTLQQDMSMQQDLLVRSHACTVGATFAYVVQKSAAVTVERHMQRRQQAACIMQQHSARETTIDECHLTNPSLLLEVVSAVKKPSSVCTFKQVSEWNAGRSATTCSCMAADNDSGSTERGTGKSLSVDSVGIDTSAPFMGSNTATLCCVRNSGMMHHRSGMCSRECAGGTCQQLQWPIPSPVVCTHRKPSLYSVLDSMTQNEVYAPYGLSSDYLTTTSGIAYINGFIHRIDPQGDFLVRFHEYSGQCPLSSLPNKESVGHNRKTIVASLLLPRTVKFPECQIPILGLPCTTRYEAVQSAALRICALLHLLGALDNKFLIKRPQPMLDGSPSVLGENGNDGYLKVKEAFPFKYPDILRRCLPQCGLPVHIYLCQFRMNTREEVMETFSCHRSFWDDEDRHFAVASSIPLQETINIKMFPRIGPTLINIVRCSNTLTFTEEELSAAKLFHHWVFTEHFSLESRPCELNFEEADRSYIVVPVSMKTMRTSNTTQPTVSGLDHEVINEVIHFSNCGGQGLRTEKSMFCVHQKADTETTFNPSDHLDDELQSFSTPSLNADRQTVTSIESRALPYQTISFPKSHWKSWHEDEVPGLHVRSKTGGRTRYMVLAVLTDMSPLSDFPADGYTNFVDYNRRKYGVEVKDKEQPLWMALPSKRIPAAHHKRMFQPYERCKSCSHLLKAKAVQLIPELCDVLPLRPASYHALSCLPVALTQLDRVMQTKELRDMLAKDGCCNCNKDAAADMDVYYNENDTTRSHSESGCNLCNNCSLPICPPIPAVMATLTVSESETYSCHYNYAQLGDVFIKQKTSQLLAANRSAVEGLNVGTSRSQLVCNQHLYACGCKSKLPLYMISTPPLCADLYTPPGYVLRQHSAEKGPGSGETGVRDSLLSPLGGASPGDSPCIDLDGDACQSKSGGRIASVTHTMSVKAVADAVEALIGVFFTYGGERAALVICKWIDMYRTLPDISTLRDYEVCHSRYFSCVNGAVEVATDDLKSKLRRFSSAETASLLSAETCHGTYLLRVQFGSRTMEQLLHPPLPPPPKSRMAQVMKLLDTSSLDFNYSAANVDALQCQLQYRFNDISWLVEAVTHRSSRQQNITSCSDMLEWLGDGIMDLLIFRMLFKSCGARQCSRKTMAMIHHTLVSNYVLGHVSLSNGLHRYLDVDSATTLSNMLDYAVHGRKTSEHFCHEKSLMEIVRAEGHLEDIAIPKEFANMFESLTGAVYMDSGMDMEETWRVFEPLMKPFIDLCLKQMLPATLEESSVSAV